MADPRGTSGKGPLVEHVDRSDAIAAALARLGLGPGRPVLVSVGGAAGMTDQHLDSVRGLLADHVLGVLDRRHATVVDGGTHSGVMRLMGESVAATGFDVPLIGVAATGTVRAPG